jgi:hypothetical protein
LLSQIIAWRNLVVGTARPCAAPSIRPIFSEGARLEICRDYDIIFVVVVTTGRI